MPEESLRIVGINIYRDGGSIEFTIETPDATTHVRLETPWAGEPRKLFINSIAVFAGDTLIRKVLKDVDDWWNAVPVGLRSETLEKLSHTGAFYNPPAESLQAIEFSRVLYVRDYLLGYYAAG